MASPYSKDLRLKVLAAYELKMKTSEIARAFTVCPAWARRVKQRFRESGEVEARPMGGARHIKIDREQLARLVAEHPDATLAELCELIDVECSQSGIGYALQSLDITLKKTIHAAEQDRPDVAARREEWRRWIEDVDIECLIFIDETWAKTNMTRLRGRAPRGERLIDKTPHGHWKTTTLIGALDCRGLRCSTVVDGAVNRDVFEAFVEQILLPQLRPGDIVVMDNLSSHKGERVTELIESVGAKVRYLPPYSPDLNPIEMIFSKIKQLLRSLACRTVARLWRAMQSVLDCVSPSDALNCFAHAGYRYT